MKNEYLVTHAPCLKKLLIFPSLKFRLICLDDMICSCAVMHEKNNFMVSSKSKSKHEYCSLL